MIVAAVGIALEATAVPGQGCQDITASVTNLRLCTCTTYINSSTDVFLLRYPMVCSKCFKSWKN